MRSSSFRAVCSVVFLFLYACGGSQEEALEADAPVAATGAALTLESIFSDEDYDPEQPGKVKWLADGRGYTALETSEAFAGSEPEQDESGDEVKATPGHRAVRPGNGRVLDTGVEPRS